MQREDRDRVGALLGEMRFPAGLRQDILAVRVGVQESVLPKIEQGQRGLDLLEARAVSDALGVPFASFAERLEATLGGQA